MNFDILYQSLRTRLLLLLYIVQIYNQIALNLREAEESLVSFYGKTV